MNQNADAVLAMVKLTRADVGRFRDAYITMRDGDPVVVVHTRNGGGNRRCWHSDDPKWGYAECKHHVIKEEAKVWAFMPKSEWPDGKAPGNVFTTKDGVFGCEYPTDETQIVDRYVCENPGSRDCACPGCVIEYRLPNHPLYLRDEDDEFDCTYADIYFRIPTELREIGLLLASDEPAPAEQHQAYARFLERIENIVRNALGPFHAAVPVIEEGIAAAMDELIESLRIAAPIADLQTQLDRVEQELLRMKAKADRNLHVPQDSTSGLNAIFGKWPGHETDEEIEKALEDMS